VERGAGALISRVGVNSRAGVTTFCEGENEFCVAFVGPVLVQSTVSLWRK
jgi:hypothetical protein